MATSLGKLNVQVGADPSGLSAGFDLAKKAVAGFAGGITGMGSMLASGLGSVFSAVGTALPNFVSGAMSGLKAVGKAVWDFMGNLATDPYGAITGLAGSLVGAVSGFVEQIPLVGPLLAMPFQGLEAAIGGVGFLLKTFDDATHNTLKVGNTARVVGMDVGDLRNFLVGLEMAGVEDPIDVARLAIKRFSVVLGEAQEAAVGTRTVFDQLGLSGQELANMSRWDALKLVAERLSSIENAAVRSSIGFKLFNRQAVYVLPFLEAGAAGFDMAKETTDFYGTGATEATLNSVRIIHQARKEFEQFKAGFGFQTAGAIAPVLAELRETFGRLPLSFKGFKDILLTGLEQIGFGVAFVVDNWGQWDTLWETLGVGWDSFVALLLDGIAAIADEFPTLFAAVEKLSDGLETLRDSTGGFAEGVSSGWKGTKNFAAGLLDTLVGTSETAKDFTSGWLSGFLGDDRETPDRGTGFRDRAAARRERAADAAFWLQAEQEMRGEEGLNKAQDAWGNFMERVRARAASGGHEAGENFQMNFLKPLQELEDAAKGPLEKFADQIHEVMRIKAGIAPEMFNPFGGDINAFVQEVGFAMMSEDILARSAFKAFEGLTSGTGTAKFGAGAMEKGSKEAFSAIQAYEATGRGGANIQEQIRAVIEAGNKQREEQVKNGKEVLAAIEKGGLKIMGF